jgi:hypothetical protein
VDLAEGEDAMDDPSPANIERLKARAHQLIAASAADLAALADALKLPLPPLPKGEGVGGKDLQ